MKLPNNHILSIYLDYESNNGNEEAKNYFLNLFSDIDSILFRNGYLCIRGTKSEGKSKINRIFPIKLPDGYFGTQHGTHLLIYKDFMKKQGFTWLE